MTGTEMDWFRGQLMEPGSPAFDEQRLMFNRRVPGAPTVIARCLGPSDVQLALSYARERGLEVFVRGGGHSLRDWPSHDGRMLIDLSLMRDVRIDPRTSTAWIGGGAQAWDLVVEASRHGLAGVTGTSTTVGVTGLLLGVGEGFLTPRHGFAADQVLEVELVTADGSLARASEDENPELFWGLRGAGANFGVVTGVRIRLHPIPEHCTGGWLTFGWEDAERVTEGMWALMENGSESFFPFLGFGPGPDGRARVSVSAGHTGPDGLAEAEIGRVRSLGTPVLDTIAPMSYLELVRQEAGHTPKRVASDLYGFALDVPPETRAAQRQLLLRHAESTTLPAAGLCLWRTIPVDPIGTPGVVPRRRGLSLLFSAWWDDPADDDAYVAWVAGVSADLAASDVTIEAANAINHVGIVENSRVRALYGAESYARLERLKDRYDPDNLFHRNYNIPPTTVGRERTTA